MNQVCKLIKIHKRFHLINDETPEFGDLVYTYEKGIPLLGKVITQGSQVRMDCGGVSYRVYLPKKVIAIPEQIGLSDIEINSIIKNKRMCEVEFEEYSVVGSDNNQSRLRPKMVDGKVVFKK